jgi:hypothetical protein
MPRTTQILLPLIFLPQISFLRLVPPNLGWGYAGSVKGDGQLVLIVKVYGCFPIGVACYS